MYRSRGFSEINERDVGGGGIRHNEISGSFTRFQAASDQYDIAQQS
jgi:hypothetical protein